MTPSWFMLIRQFLSSIVPLYFFCMHTGQLIMKYCAPQPGLRGDRRMRSQCSGSSWMKVTPTWESKGGDIMWQPEEDIERRSCMCMFSFIGKTKHHVAADCGTLHPYREFFKKKKRAHFIVSPNSAQVDGNFSLEKGNLIWLCFYFVCNFLEKPYTSVCIYKPLGIVRF